MVVLRMGCGRQYNFKRVAGLFIFREDDSFNYYFVKTWWRGKIAYLSIIIITLLNFWFQRFKNSDDWFHLLVTKSDIKVKIELTDLTIWLTSVRKHCPCRNSSCPVWKHWAPGSWGSRLQRPDILYCILFYFLWNASPFAGGSHRPHLQLPGGRLQASLDHHWRSSSGSGQGFDLIIGSHILMLTHLQLLCYGLVWSVTNVGQNRVNLDCLTAP